MVFYVTCSCGSSQLFYAYYFMQRPDNRELQYKWTGEDHWKYLKIRLVLINQRTLWAVNKKLPLKIYTTLLNVIRKQSKPCFEGNKMKTLKQEITKSAVLYWWNLQISRHSLILIAKKYKVLGGLLCKHYRFNVTSMPSESQFPHKSSV